MSSPDPRIAALETNLWSQWSQFGRPEGCSLTVREGLTWFDTPIPSLPYNAVIRCQLGADAEARVNEVVAHYAARGVPHFWFVHPTSSPANLGRLLEARGIALAETATGMVATPRALAPAEAAPDGVEIRAVTPADRDLVLEFVAARWSAPPEAVPTLQAVFATSRIGYADGGMRAWIATRDGRLIGKGFTHRNGSTVGLYGVATRPEARDLGVARALCLTALHESKVPDTELFVLHSSPAAKSLYRKIGFNEIAPFHVYVHGQAFHV